MICLLVCLPCVQGIHFYTIISADVRTDFQLPALDLLHADQLAQCFYAVISHYCSRPLTTVLAWVLVCSLDKFMD